MKDTFFRLYGYMKKSAPLLVLSVLCALIVSVCTLLSPVVLGKAMDSMTGAGLVDFDAAIKYIAVLAALYLMTSLFGWLLNRATNKIAYTTVGHIRESMFNRLILLPSAFYDRASYGDTASRFVNDADSVSDGLLNGLMALIQGVITIIGSAVIMLILNIPMAATVILSAPAAFFVARFITLRSQKRFGEQAARLGELNGYAEEIIDGHRIIKAFGRQEKVLKEFSEINSRLYKAGLKAQIISALSNPSTRIVNNLSYAVTGVVSGYLAISGRITVGTVSSFLIFAVIFAKPFNEITGVLTQIQSAFASAQRIFRLLDEKPEVSDEDAPEHIEECRGEVIFENVSFSYNPDKPLIENLNLHIKPGSKVAIVGPTGAGKTTLVNLLMRFYDVNSGSISIDGIDIRNLKRQNLREQFGMVLQDTWLFGGTVRQNIAYGKHDATDEEIIEAAKNAGADSFIRRLPKGYDTRIRAGGENLSAGQKQLLTIARIMLVNPPMLILDEATSNIDTHTEQKIQRAFDKLTEGRTGFIIAHRLSTIINADIILVMDNGRIVEQGDHESLMSQNGLYAALYNSQFS